MSPFRSILLVFVASLGLTSTPDMACLRQELIKETSSRQGVAKERETEVQALQRQLGKKEKEVENVQARCTALMKERRVLECELSESDEKLRVTTTN